MGSSLSSFDKSATDKLHAKINAILDAPPPIRDRCMTEYNAVISKELKNIPKLHIKSINDEVFFVPNSLAIHTEKAMMTKKVMCEKISSHYAKILSLLAIVKEAYNSEKNGANKSFFDNVKERNFIFDKKKLIGIRYSEEIQDGKKNPLESVPGIKDLFDALDETGKNVFSGQIYAIISRDNAYLSKLACGDELFTTAEYYGLYPYEPLKKPLATTCRGYKEQIALKKASQSSMFPPMMAILPGQQGKKMKEIMLSSLDAKQKAAVMKCYNSMTRRVTANLEKIRTLVDRVVSKEGEITHMTEESLATYHRDVTKTIASYYISILSEFDAIVLKIQSFSKKL